MLEKETIMVVRCELKIPSLGITVRHHSARLMMPNSYPRDRIFNPHRTAIKILIVGDSRAWRPDVFLTSAFDVIFRRTFRCQRRILEPNRTFLGRKKYCSVKLTK